MLMCDLLKLTQEQPRDWRGIRQPFCPARWRPPAQIEEAAVLFICDLAKKYALHHPEQVDRGKNNPRSGEHRRDIIPVSTCRDTERVRLEHADHNQEFADEAIKEWQRDRR